MGSCSKEHKRVHKKKKETFFGLMALPWSNAPTSHFIQPNITGNCLSYDLDFKKAPQRFFHLTPPQTSLSMGLDVSLYDFTIDYGSINFNLRPDGMALSVRKSEDGAHDLGIRVGTTRYILYGKITVRMLAAAIPGIVSSAITMSDIGDEIDWEFVGHKSQSVQTNVFYKGIHEYGSHSQQIAVDNIELFHNYTIDWKKDDITWSIDGVVVRTLFRNQSHSNLIPPYENWYPQTASKIQFGIWNGGDSNTSGTSEWAGGPVYWGSNTTFTSIFGIY